MLNLNRHESKKKKVEFFFSSLNVVTHYLRIHQRLIIIKQTNKQTNTDDCRYFWPEIIVHFSLLKKKMKILPNQNELEKRKQNPNIVNTMFG